MLLNITTTGQVHSHQNHIWHMKQLAKVCQQGAPFLLETPYRVIDVTNSDSEQVGIEWTHGCNRPLFLHRRISKSISTLPTDSL